MPQTTMITGSTDGIGLETARMLTSQGRHVLLHGRNPAKDALDSRKSGEIMRLMEEVLARSSR